MSTRKPKRYDRGQANVEMAVVMVALVPIFLYVLTADDLLRYRLNLQEVVVSSPWDYTHLDYERQQEVPGNALESKLRQTYENINNTYSITYNKAPSQEKTAPMTFAGWTVPGSERINCDKNKNFANDFSGPISNLAGVANKGGLYSCKAALAVRNVELVGDFFQHWAGDTKLTNKTPGTAQSAWGLNRQKFSVMADTWAMTRVDNVNPGTHSGVLYDRINAVYRGTPVIYELATWRARQFVWVDANEILGIPFLTETDGSMGDNTRTPEVGFSKTAEPWPSVNFNNNQPFDSSPWRSKGAGGKTHQQVYQSRERTYMGLPLQ